MYMYNVCFKFKEYILSMHYACTYTYIVRSDQNCADLNCCWRKVGGVVVRLGIVVKLSGKFLPSSCHEESKYWSHTMCMYDMYKGSVVINVVMKGHLIIVFTIVLMWPRVGTCACTYV